MESDVKKDKVVEPKFISKHFNFKRVLLVLLVVLITASIFSAIGYLLGISQSSSSISIKPVHASITPAFKRQGYNVTESILPTPTPVLNFVPNVPTVTKQIISSVDTNGWKTFSCSFQGSYKFSVKYPSQWYVVDNGDTCGEKDDHEEFVLSNYPHSPGVNGYPNYYAIDIEFNANGGYLGGEPISAQSTVIDALSGNDLHIKDNPGKLLEIDTTTIGGKTAYSLLVDTRVDGKSNDPWTVLIPNGLVQFDDLSEVTGNAETQLFNAILNSVKL